MKLAIFLIAVIVGAALVNAVDVHKVMLRGSEVEASQGVSGNIDTQITIQDENLSHALNRHERHLVGSCFINSYNDAHATTGYQVQGFRIKMSHYSNSTGSEDGNMISLYPHKVIRLPIIFVNGGISWYCDFCSPLLASSSDVATNLANITTNVPPLNEDFLIFFQDCLITGGYPASQQVNVSLFAPTLTTFLDPLFPLSSSEVAPPAVPATPTLSNTDGTSSESDIFFYGLSAELSSNDLDYVSECFTQSYNQLFQSSDWSAIEFTVFWQTVIGVGTTPNGESFSFQDLRVKNVVKGGGAYSYLLMDVSIDYGCTTCNVDDKPGQDASSHNSLENRIAHCLTQTKSKAFLNLDSIEIRNMLSVSTATTKRKVAAVTAIASKTS